jgi:hypothetical protein
VGQIPSIQFASSAEYTSRSFGSSDPTISEGDVLADGSTVVSVSVSTGTSSATIEQAGQMDTTETNQYGSAGSSSGQQSSGSSYSGGGY